MIDPSNNPQISPVFMFGFERSGTTLLSMMVGSHPEIAVPLSATGIWYRYNDELGRFGDLAEAAALEKLVDALLAEERVRLWDASIERADILAAPRPANYPDVVRRFHEVYAASKNKPCWANLDIATLDNMEVVNRWFPDAKFIHIVRDGRDVALSHETMPYGASNTLECAEKWVHRLTVSLKMGALLGAERYLVVRYEDLILDTASALGEICRFVGLSYDPGMLAYHEMVDAKIPKDKQWLWPALSKPPVKSKAYAWKRTMSRTKRLVFEGTAGEMLKSLRYEASDVVPKSIGRYLYELYCFVGRGGRIKRFASKLGMRRASKLERNAKGST